MPGPFSYTSSLQPPPPAPTCVIKFSSNANSEEIEALIDSGAGMTCIPEKYVHEWGMRKISEANVLGVTGSERCGIYLVHLEIFCFNFMSFRFPVMAISLSHAIIGRDILNRHTLLLSGPSRQFTIN